MNLKISVIMPVYNAHKYLDRAISSILNQTYNNIELICVDDCSTDDSVEIIKNWKKNDKRVKLVKNSVNSGPAYSRDNGLSNAIGEYVAFIDSDDYYEQDALEFLYSELIKTTAPTIFSNWYITNEKESVPQHYYQTQLYTVDKECYSFFISPWGKLFKKDFLNKNNIKFGKHRISDDRFFLCQVYVHSKEIKLTDKLTYHWVQHEDSVSHIESSKENPKFFEALQVADECYNFVKKHNLNIFYPDSEMDRLLDWCFRIDKHHLRNFIIQISKIIKKWNLSKEQFEKIEKYMLYKNFCNQNYRSIHCSFSKYAPLHKKLFLLPFYILEKLKKSVKFID